MFRVSFPIGAFGLAACLLMAVLVLEQGASAQEPAPSDDAARAVEMFNQAQGLHEKGDLAGAVGLYGKALEILPEFPEAEYQRAMAYLGLGRDADAEASLRSAISHRADWTLAQASLGSLLVSLGKLEEAERLLLKVLAAEPQNPPALAAITELFLRNKAEPSVLQALLAKLVNLTSKANPTASLWSARAAIERSFGQKSAARSSIQNALTIDPKHATSLFQAAEMALADADVDLAKAVAARLDASGANADRIKILRAEVLAQEGKTDEALKLIEPLRNKNSAADELRSRINAATSGNAPDLEKQLAANEKDAALLGRLCKLYRRDDPPKALNYCRRAAEAEPENISHAVGFGAALVQAKQFEAAAGVLRKILDLSPDNATARANLATALFQLKRFGEAKREFLWLTSAQPRSAAAYYFLAISHDQLGEYIDAMANYQQYLRLADATANALEIDKVNLRLPALERLMKDRKGKK